MPPTYDALVVHHHELGLKGKNREFFESVLTRNLKRALKDTGYLKTRRLFGRVMIDLAPDALAEVAAERAAKVYGVAYVGLGRRVTSPNMEELGRIALEYIQAEPFESFRVRSRRTYSSFDSSSKEIHEVVGKRIQDATGGRVDLKHADATAWIELFAKTGIVIGSASTEPVAYRRVLVAGCSVYSRVASIRRSRAWRMARRGATIELVHFHGQPFTDPSSVRQAAELAQALTEFHPTVLLHLVPLGDVQREIVTNCPSELRVILYRRFMMRIAAELLRQRSGKALITGDALGQVASQTIENITTISSAVPDVQVIRPLVGMTKQEIMDDAEKMGTYEISTRKYQDCCVLFEPRNPAIRSTPEEATTTEAALDVDELVGKALAGVEARSFELPPPR